MHTTPLNELATENLLLTQEDGNITRFDLLYAPENNMRLQRTLACLVTTFCVSSLLANWPEFRGPSKDGVVSGVKLPTVWSADQNIVWRSELPGEGWSSPVVVGDSAFLTAAIAAESDSEKPRFELALLILDVSSGTLTKRLPLFTESPDSPGIHSKNSHASPTAVLSGSHLYLHFGHQGTACTTLEGEVIWKNDTLGYPPVHGNGGSPAVVDNLLIFSRDGADISEVTALDAATGQVVWQRERDIEANKRFSFCTPLSLTVDGRGQLIVPGSNVVQSLDPQTGAELWRVTYDGYSVVPRPIYESGLVYVCTGFDRPSLLAIDPTGSGDVTDTHVKWQTNSNIPNTPSLVGFDGKIAMISDKGIASCFDATSGRQLWKERIGGNFSASPILSGSLMYMLSEDGVCTVLDVSSEPTEIAVNRLDERSLASPAVVGNDLLIRTSAALYRISDAKP